MIVVTGATGALNGATVDHLLEFTPAHEIAVVARDTAKAQRFAELGITVRHGDYAEPGTLPAAFEGADQLLLVSSSEPGADAVSLHRSAISAAVQAEVGRIVYTSHQGAALDNPFGPARDHAATELLLAASGIPWTALRNGFYAHSLAWLLGSWRDSGRIVVPGDGPVSWTAREDEAEAAALILASDGTYDGPITLTAGSAPTFSEIAVICSEIVGRDVGVRVVDEDEWLASQLSQSAPENRARFTLGIFRAASEGKFAGVDPLMAKLLGREPHGVRDVLRSNGR